MPMPTPVHASSIPFILEELRLIGPICPIQPIKVNINLRYVGFEDGRWSKLTQDNVKWQAVVLKVLNTLHSAAILFVNINFIFLLLVFCKFLEPNRHFTLKMASTVHDSFIGFSFMNIDTLLDVTLLFLAPSSSSFVRAQGICPRCTAACRPIVLP
jgi:hypothetical protein